MLLVQTIEKIKKSEVLRGRAFPNGDNPNVYKIECTSNRPIPIHLHPHISCPPLHLEGTLLLQKIAPKL